MVRFGGPGAPTFVLKSFSASFENLVRELCGENGEQSKGACSPTTAGKPSPSLTPTTPRPSNRFQLLTKEDGPQASGPCSPKSALVALNTRVNALGGGALLSQRNRMIARQAAPKFVIGSEVLDQIDSCLLGKRGRSEDMMSYTSDDDCGGFSCDCSVRQPKRSRSATYPLSPDPIRGCLKQDMTSNLMQTPLIYERLLTTMEVEFFGKNDARRKVKFAEETQNFYPASVTPDEGSFDEEHMKQ